MIRKSILVFSLVVAVAMSAQSATRKQSPSIFDGTRKSLVMGLGCGYAFGSIHPEGRQKVSWHGLGACLMIGHGWDKQNIVALEFSGITFLEGFRNISYPRGYDRDYPDGMSFSGISWHHYFRPTARSGIISLGLGYCLIEENNAGLGLRFGAGFELVKHLPVMGHMIIGPSSQAQLGYSLSRLGIFIIPLAY